MKGKAAVAMVKKTAETLNLPEGNTVLLAAFYLNGKWRKFVETEELDEIWENYQNGIVGDMITNFCLDILSGKVPPNWLVNKCNSMKIPKKGK